MLLLRLAVIAKGMDVIGDDEFHTSYDAYDKSRDTEPSCNPGNSIRIDRSVDLTTCMNHNSGNMCTDCEIFRIRYVEASAPCVEKDANFRERYEDEEEAWMAACPCYPNCNGTFQLRVSLLVALLSVLSAIALS